MLTQAVHSSSTSVSQYDSQSFNQKTNKHSLAHTVKKTIVVSSIALGGVSLLAGVTLIGIATAGLAIPIAVPFVLGIFGATGITGAGCVLNHMKFNQSTKNMLKVTHILKESTEGLKEALESQKDASNLTTGMLKNLENRCFDVNANQEEIIQGLKRNEEQVREETGQVEKAGRELSKQSSLLRSLNKRLEAKLQGLQS